MERRFFCLLCCLWVICAMITAIMSVSAMIFVIDHFLLGLDFRGIPMQIHNLACMSGGMLLFVGFKWVRKKASTLITLFDSHHK